MHLEKHVMLDLETFGLRVGSVIRSVGAVEFNPATGKLGDEFYCNVLEQSCLDLGMTKDEDTIRWWNSPKMKGAQDALLVDPLPLSEVNERFVKFFNKCEGEFIWSQGANFDEPLYSHALALTGHQKPWKFFNSRDTRTMYHAVDLNVFLEKRAGTYHNALDDAKHQAMLVSKAYRRMRSR
jgi:hypothetical protein